MSGAGPAAGVVLAAGAGTRMGRPKALVGAGEQDGWLRRAIGVLRDGGCDPVLVVLGAEADRAAALVGDLAVEPVVVPDWSDGLSASLAAGLDALRSTGAGVAVITLVDLPDLTSAVVRRLLDRLGTDPSVLGRATYAGAPGHPVVIGRDHWDAVRAGSRGDRGARDYLAASAELRRVECGDLSSGRDVDSPSGI